MYLLRLPFLFHILTVYAADDCAAKNNSFIGGQFDSNLPLIIITTPSSVPSATEDKIIGSMKVYDNRPGRTSLSGSANAYEGAIKIGRRGQSSDVIYCKKQYSIKTRWANDTKRDVPLLGMPEESDWVVQGPYADKTQQRQALMMTLSENVGMYAPRFVFVELFLIENGASAVSYSRNYMGVYLLMEQIGRGSDRVDVKKLTNKSSDLSGGYIIKKDKNKDGNVNFMTSGNLVLSMVYPDEESVTPQQLNWIGSYISCFEDALYSSSFTDPVFGYANFINVSNFIDYFLLSELSNNADSYKFSTYMYKEKAAVLNMGPLWDYDLAFGNIADWLDQESSCRPPSMNPGAPCTNIFAFRYAVNAINKISDTSAWFARLLADPVFKQLVKSRWQDLRATVLSDNAIATIISAQSTQLNEAVVRNFQKWRDPGLSGEIWPEPNTLDRPCCYPTYNEHVEFLRRYAQGRAAWMDGALGRSMYTISTPPPPLPCCSDPQFKSCPKPTGGTCTADSGQVKSGIGKFFDPTCQAGLKGKEGCESLGPQGSCRFCLAPNWNPLSGAGSASWIKCNLCIEQSVCVPSSPTPLNPTPGLPTGQPSLAPSLSPSTAQPTKPGDTLSPSPAPSLQPTSTPVQPTPRQTNVPSIVPLSRAPSVQVVDDAEAVAGGSSVGVYLAVGAGIIFAATVIGAVVWYVKTHREKRENSLLHQGLLQ